MIGLDFNVQHTDGLEGLKTVPESSTALVIADCGQAMAPDWADEVMRILKPSGYLCVCSTYMGSTAFSHIGNYVSRRFIVVGGFEAKDTVVGTAMWLVFQVSPWPRPPWQGVRWLKYGFPKNQLGNSQRSTLNMIGIVVLLTKAGDLVVDVCAGWGTVAIACHRVGCRYLGFEEDRKRTNEANLRLQGRWPREATC